jgi:hypothetical protein
MSPPSIVPISCRSPAVAAFPQLGQLFAAAAAEDQIGGALQIDAAAAGRASPVVREDPSAADWDDLAQRMLDLGTTPEELQHVFDGTVSSISQSRKCEIGKDLYEGMARLPTERAARIGAFLLIPDEA